MVTEGIIYVAWDSRTDCSLFASISPVVLKHRCDKRATQLGYEWEDSKWGVDEEGVYWRDYSYDLESERMAVEPIPYFELTPERK